jgi:hypothetical protein
MFFISLDLIDYIKYETQKAENIDEFDENFDPYCVYLLEYLLPAINCCYKLFGSTQEDK